MTDVPLGPSEIRAHLEEVATALAPEGPRHSIVMVGGALLAWHGLRSSTLDVDSARRFDDDLADAVRTVARRHGLAPLWLNHSASAYLPQGFQEAECDVLLDAPRLLVLGAPLRQVFLMKMHAARDRDWDDLVAIWPLLGMSPRDVIVDYEIAYPLEPTDPHLLSWVTSIAAAADAR